MDSILFYGVFREGLTNETEGSSQADVWQKVFQTKAKALRQILEKGQGDYNLVTLKREKDSVVYQLCGVSEGCLDFLKSSPIKRKRTGKSEYSDL